MEAKVKLRFLKVAPRKVRLIAQALRGLKVALALEKLNFVSKASALPLKKLILSAQASAKEKYKNVTGVENWQILEIRVDEGPMLKRQMPISKGRAVLIRKKMSHVTLTISPKEKELKHGTKD